MACFLGIVFWGPKHNKKTASHQNTRIYRMKGLMKKIGKKTRDTKQADVSAISEFLIKLTPLKLELTWYELAVIPIARYK